MGTFSDDPGLIVCCFDVGVRDAEVGVTWDTVRGVWGVASSGVAAGEAGREMGVAPGPPGVEMAAPPFTASSYLRCCTDNSFFSIATCVIASRQREARFIFSIVSRLTVLVSSL